MMDSFIPGSSSGGGGVMSGDSMASSFVPGGGTSMSGDQMAGEFVPGGYYGGQATSAQDSFSPTPDDSHINTGDGIDVSGSSGPSNVGPSYGASNIYNAEETGNFASDPNSVEDFPSQAPMASPSPYLDSDSGI